MLKKIFLIIFSHFAIAGILFCSCNKDEPSPQEENYNKFKMYYNALFNTTWKVVEDKFYIDDKLFDNRLQKELEEFNADEKIIHLTSTKVKRNDGLLVFYATCNLMPDAESSSWWIEDEYDNFDINNNPLPHLAIVIRGDYQGEYATVTMAITITQFNSNRIEMDYTETEKDGTKHRWLTVLEKLSDDTPSS